MIVIAVKNDPNDIRHVLNRLHERVDEDSERWFFSLLAEINHYIPDDWRMTNRSNNFRLQVVTPNKQFALVGHSYKRKNGESILHIIDTILLKGHFNIFKAQEISSKSGDKYIKKRAKAENPELIQPNLYYFQPCPEDSNSPLFARQFERIKINKNKQVSGTQYHRIHPLTKAGLDLEHFKWIKWDINGNIEFVDYPSDDYHASNYWNIPALLNKTGRATEEDYINQYNSYLEKYNIEEPEKIDTLTTPYERELKYSYEGNIENFTNLLKSIKAAMLDEGFDMIWTPPKEQVDIYLDDEDYTLYRKNISFRLRKKKDSARITLKKRLPLEAMSVPPGMYLRMEEEVAISKKQETQLLKGERINSFPYRLVAYLAPEAGPISKALEVKNKRTTGILSLNNIDKIEICHDIIYFLHDSKERGPFFEIEVESKGAEKEIIDIIAGIFENKFNLQLSSGTKYERGIKELGLR